MHARPPAQAALDVLFTAQVHERQDNGDSGGGASGRVRAGGGGVRNKYQDPPGRWAGATNVGGDVYFRADPDAADVLSTLVVWHWCPDSGAWRAVNPHEHDLVAVQPLHLEPSLLWECCGKHGFVRGGRWVDA